MKIIPNSTENFVDRKLTVEEVKALKKLIGHCQVAAELFYKEKFEKENFQNLIQALSRINKNGLALYFVRYISKNELESLQKILILTEDFIQQGYQENKLSDEFKREWYNLINKITRNQHRWLKF